MTSDLTQRQQKVLWATVDYYVATAEPVGSSALAKNYQFSLSPATIRNVMSMLEKSGLLYQPHTSAGRIPSDSGYRLYVNELMQPSSRKRSKIEHILAQKLGKTSASFEVLLRHSAQLLAALSGCIALITTPQSSLCTIRHLQLLVIEPQRIMFIVVTDTYETHSIVVSLPSQLQQTKDLALLEQELQILTNFLNHKLQGTSFADLTTLDWSELDRQFQQYGDLLQQLLNEVVQQTQPPTTNQLLVGGLSEFLRQPEFSELNQAQTIIHLLEENQAQLWPLIFEWSTAPAPFANKPRVSIRIGAENPLEPIQNCALVSSHYQKGDMPIGSVGILGPTRMAYDKVIALVEGTADYLSDRLNLSQIA